MKEIKLTKGAIVLVDDEDYILLIRHRWCLSNKYAVRREGPRGANFIIYMHKQILNTIFAVDHINNNPLDNRRANLRLANKAQNSQNRPLQANNTSGYKGVSYCQGKWQAYIKVKGNKINLGTFTLKEEAAFAYNQAAKLHFKEFAQLNIIA